MEKKKKSDFIFFCTEIRWYFHIFIIIIITTIIIIVVIKTEKFKYILKIVFCRISLITIYYYSTKMSCPNIIMYYMNRVRIDIS